MFKSLNDNSKYLYFTTIFGLFLFNLLLKINFLDAEPFWYDEIISVKSALLDFGHIKHQSEWDNNPPFYYYCLWVWIRLLGVSELKIRLLSVIFSCISASLIFVLAKKYFNYLTALFSALIFSLHDFSYAYTHEARCYTLVVLLTLLSTIVFMKLMRNANYKIIILLGLINFLIIYTHYITGLVLIFQFILLLVFKRPGLKPYLISLGICLILVIIRFTKKQVLLILSYEKGSETFWLKTADANSVKTALISLFSGANAWIFLLLLFIISVIFVFYARKKMTHGEFPFLIYCFFIGGLSIFCLALIGIYKPIFLDRYLLFTIPFIAILVGWFICNSSKIMYLLIIPILFLQCSNLVLNPKKTMDFRLAANVVKDIKGNSDALIIIQTKDLTGLFTYYYKNELFIDFKTMQKNLKKNKVLEIENSADLNGLPYKNENIIIFCQTFEKESDNIQIFNIFKQNNFVFATSKSVKGVKISLLRKNKSL
ncbi:MAG TPA: glycosyltransferase family 39 protein [Bacteroidia bacterium]|jgi:uncharacterized membrane protein|nr:glycosyltransferase family 39 protein [Bacteroidia bacterium]